MPYTHAPILFLLTAFIIYSINNTDAAIVNYKYDRISTVGTDIELTCIDDDRNSNNNNNFVFKWRKLNGVGYKDVCWYHWF